MFELKKPASNEAGFDHSFNDGLLVVFLHFILSVDHIRVIRS